MTTSATRFPNQRTVSVSSGNWSASERFRLSSGPRYQPVMADEEGAAQALLDWAQPGDVLVLPVHAAAVRGRLTARLAGRPDAVR